MAADCAAAAERVGLSSHLSAAIFGGDCMP
jgi:hypothetical protein